MCKTWVISLKFKCGFTINDKTIMIFFYLCLKNDDIIEFCYVGGTTGSLDRRLKIKYSIKQKKNVSRRYVVCNLYKYLYSFH